LDVKVLWVSKNHRNAVAGSAYTFTAHTLSMDQLHYYTEKLSSSYCTLVL
jgi:hypothetical protein